MSYSKYFNAAIRKHPYNCTDLFHVYHVNCFREAIRLYSVLWISVAQFFAAPIMVSILSKIDRLKPSDFKKYLFDYLDLIKVGYFFSGMTVTLPCILWRVVGPQYYGLNFIPTLLSALFIFIGKQQAAITYSHCFQSFMAAVFLTKSKEYFKTTRGWKSLYTFIFMGGSASLFHLMNYVQPPYKWLINPVKQRTEDTESVTEADLELNKDQSVCYHKGHCIDYTIKGISTNFKLASLLTLARFTVKNFYLLKNPFNFVIAFFKTFKPDVFLFMMGYTGIYRALSCTFNNKFKKSTKLSEFIAVYLAGSSFYFMPDTTLLAHVMAAVVQCIGMYGLTLPRFSKYNSIPFYKLGFVVLAPIAFHIRLYYPWLAPSFLKELMRLGTHNKSTPMIYNAEALILGFTPVRNPNLT